MLNIDLKACQSSERYGDISSSTNGFSSNENPKTVQTVELKNRTSILLKKWPLSLTAAALNANRKCILWRLFMKVSGREILFDCGFKEFDTGFYVLIFPNSGTSISTTLFNYSPFFKVNTNGSECG